MARGRTPRRRSESTKPRVQSQRKHSRWLLALAAVSIAFAAGITYVALQSPFTRVQNVRVVGAETLDTQGLADLSGLKDQSMLRLNLDGARKKLLAIPQVRTVEFSRDWPNTVTMRIAEREPWGFWSVGGKDYPVDIDGVVLAAGAPSQASTRIVEPDSNRIMGPGDRVDPDAIALADRVFRESPTVLGRTIDELEYKSGVGITAVFTNGMRVTFGDDRAYDYKMKVLSTLLDTLKAKGKTPQAVDLRFGERVTYE
ncbi:MAG TPA: FtsQ-type POTRA domain-containing protein [Dehalococcoidia bacterium]